MAEASDPIDVGETVEVKISGFVAADPFVNVVHYNCLQAPTGANILVQLQNTVRAIWETLGAAYLPLLPTDGRVTGLRIVRVNTWGSPTWREGVVDNGTHDGDYLPVEDAIVFKKLTLQSGVGQAGSLYMPAISEAVNIGDYVEVGNPLITAMRAAIGAEITMEGGGGWKPVVWSRKTQLAPGESHEIVDVGINAKISHQRRRKPRF